MIKRILILITNLSALLLVVAQAPAIEWQKALGGSSVDYANSVQQTADGGYIVAGSSFSDDGDVAINHGYYDAWIVKLNSTGGIQWQKSLGGSDYDEAYSIQQTSDGGYIVAGFFNYVTNNLSDTNYWIIKLDATGTIQWQKSLGGNFGDYAFSIQQTSEGGYVVAGYSASKNGDVTGNHGSQDFWIVKLNHIGDIQWQKSFGGSREDLAYSIQQTLDGGYILAGNSYSNDGDVTGNHGSSDYWVVKLANNGDLIWQKSLGGSGQDMGRSVRQTSDGGYIVAGASGSKNGDVTGNHGEYDAWVVKLNSIGSMEWQKSLGGNDYDYAHSIQQTSDGGYVLAGYSSSKNGDITGNHGNADFWMVKLTGTGSIQWQKSLGGSSSDVAFSVQQTADSGYIVASSTNSRNGDVTGFHGDQDYWIVKLAPDYLNMNEVFSNNILTIENPVKNKINIHTREKITVFQLYDWEGKLIKTSKSKNMPLPELRKGIYILNIQLENGSTISKKIIKD